MYTRNSQSAVTSDEDRGDKSTLPREVSSEKKKAHEPADVASARSPCLNTVRAILLLLLPPPSPSVPRESGQSDFSTREKKKKKLNIENRSVLVTTLIPKSH